MRTFINMDGIPGIVIIVATSALLMLAVIVAFEKLARPRIERTLNRWKRELRNLPDLCAYALWAEARRQKPDTRTLATVRALIDGAR